MVGAVFREGGPEGSPPKADNWVHADDFLIHGTPSSVILGTSRAEGVKQGRQYRKVQRVGTCSYFNYFNNYFDLFCMAINAEHRLCKEGQ